MKNRNILIGILSTLCVILIAVIALLSVRFVNLSDSASENRNKTAGSKGKDRTESGPKAGSSESKNKADAGSTAGGSGADGITQNGENRNGGDTAGDSRAENSRTDSFSGFSGGGGGSGSSSSRESRNALTPASIFLSFDGEASADASAPDGFFSSPSMSSFAVSADWFCCSAMNCFPEIRYKL